MFFLCILSLFLVVLFTSAFILSIISVFTTSLLLDFLVKKCKEIKTENIFARWRDDTQAVGQTDWDQLLPPQTVEVIKALSIRYLNMSTSIFDITEAEKGVVWTETGWYLKVWKGQKVEKQDFGQHYWWQQS